MTELLIVFKEAAVLRRKVEELEQDRDSLKTQVKELSDKIASTTAKPTTNSTVTLRRNTSKTNNLAEEKVKVRKQLSLYNNVYLPVLKK